MGTIVWLIVFLAAVLMLVAELPDQLTYRISVPAGRAVGAARAPLAASALALILGVALVLLTGKA